MPLETLVLPVIHPEDDVGAFSHNHAGFSYFDDEDDRCGIIGFERSHNSTEYMNWGAWFRFNLPLIKEDEIEEAYIRFYDVDTILYDLAWPWNLEARLMAHAHDNSPGPTTLQESKDQSSTGATTARVAWLVEPEVVQAERRTPNLKTILDELKNRAGWVKDNAITLYSRTHEPRIDTVDVDKLLLVRRQFFDKFHHRTAPGNYPWGTTDHYPHLIITYYPSPPPGAGYHKHIVHDLQIISTQFPILLRGDVEHTLTFEQDIIFVLEHNKSVEHTLEIEQDINRVRTHEKRIEHIVVPFQDVQGNISRIISVEHTITFQQDIQPNLSLFKTVVSQITFEQDISRIYVYNESVESILNITHFINHSPRNLKFEHVVTLQQGSELDAQLQRPQFVQHTISFEQDIIANAVRTRTIETDVTISQSVLGFSDKLPSGWTPTGGGNPPGVDSPPSLPPPAGVDITDVYFPQADSTVNFPPQPVLVKSSVTLQYPPTNPTLTLVLPSPLFSNREELLLTRIQRRTRGGDLKTFSDDIWPKIKMFRYKFDSLPNDKIEEVFSFFAQTLGLQCRLTDYEGRQWDGFIVNPGGESAQFFRQCGQTTEFDFDGVEV